MLVESQVDRMVPPARGGKVRVLERRSVRRTLALTAAYLILAGGVAFIMLPVIWMISTSLKDLGSVFLFPPQVIPDPIIWHNYVDAWNAAPFTLFLRNTLVITFAAMAGEVFSSALVAFGFARLRGYGSSVLFIVLLSTIMLPYHVKLIPTFILI